MKLQDDFPVPAHGRQPARQRAGLQGLEEGVRAGGIDVGPGEIGMAREDGLRHGGGAGGAIQGLIDEIVQGVGPARHRLSW